MQDGGGGGGRVGLLESWNAWKRSSFFGESDTDRPEILHVLYIVQYDSLTTGHNEVLSGAFIYVLGIFYKYFFTEVKGNDIPLLLSKPMDPSFSFAPISKQEMISA
jgi:hypothetical protein